MLKTIIPESIWAQHRCLVVHPGPRGDRGPSSLDWAIELGDAGVGRDGARGQRRGRRRRRLGDAHLPHARGRARAACTATRCGAPRSRPSSRRWAGSPTAPARRRRRARRPARRPAAPRPLMTPGRPRDRLATPTPPQTVLRKIRAAEGHPGVLDAIEGTEFHLFGAHRERALRGAPGRDRRPARTAPSAGRPSTARSGSPTSSAATRRRSAASSSRPRARSRSPARGSTRPRCPVAARTRRCRRARPSARSPTRSTRGVGYLHFDFYNGAMSTEQCRRLREAYRYARSRRQTKVIVLMGGSDFFSNGIHLNVIEAADDPAAESWRNLHAIDDLVREIIETDSHLVVSALAGDAAAGGVPLRARRRPRRRARGRRAEPVLPAHGRPLRLGVLDLPAAAPRRRRRRPPGSPAPPFTPAGHPPGGRDRAARRRLRRHRWTTSAPRPARWPSASRSGPDVDRLARGQAARGARATRRPSRSTPTAARSWPARTRCFFGADRSYHEARRRFVHKLGAPCAVPPAAAMPAHEAPRAGRRAA